MQIIKHGPDVPDRLLQAHEDGNVVFFCGAGISYPAKLPGFDGLVNRIYQGLREDPNETEQLAINKKQYDTALGLLEGRMEMNGGRFIVREQLAKALIPDLSAPNATDTHKALLTLARSAGKLRLVTTNFDCLFETVISTNNLIVKTFQAPFLPVPKNRWDGLVYLHGLLPSVCNPTLADLDHLVITSGDFGLAYLNERWASRFVSEFFRNCTVCFVGYSIDDPILRYMMDALAADKLRGERVPEMFAFGSFTRSGADETQIANASKAKNVTPILYRDTNNHSLLHEILRTWADTYRDGTKGKERIVGLYAANHPNKSTIKDDIVGRMLWALSDKRGLPAKLFAEHKPLPPLGWLKPFAEARFNDSDLMRFGVAPVSVLMAAEAEPFSLLSRPAPYIKAPMLALVADMQPDNEWDEVMYQIACWLIRHISDPELVLWLTEKGGRLHPRFATMLRAAVNNPVEGKPLTPAMRTVWGLFLAGRVKPRYERYDLNHWFYDLKRDTLIPSLRFKLREILCPKVQFRASFGFPKRHAGGKGKGITRSEQIVAWDITLGAADVRQTLLSKRNQPYWRQALPDLLVETTNILRDALDLMRELGDVDDQHDRSYRDMPSISDHAKNHNYREWTALIVLVRDAWNETAVQRPELAHTQIIAWLRIPYPVFKRLAFFAATSLDSFTEKESLRCLLSDGAVWLWSWETANEALLLLMALVPKLDDSDLSSLLKTIMQGPPRSLFADTMQPEMFQQFVDEFIWLRLARTNAVGAHLTDDASAQLQTLTTKYPYFALAANDSNEYPGIANIPYGREMVASLPVDQPGIVTWLREHPKPPEWTRDEWLDRCRDDFTTTSGALVDLARVNEWPRARLSQALLAWGRSDHVNDSWHALGTLLSTAPDDVLVDIAEALCFWLQEVPKAINGDEEIFFKIIQRILAIARTSSIDKSAKLQFQTGIDAVERVTNATIRWWFLKPLEDGQGLPPELGEIFTELCDKSIPAFKTGRKSLAEDTITLLNVAPVWAIENLLPNFNWKQSKIEAQAAWQGFLMSPRFDFNLMERIKASFLETAQHYTELGELGSQYARLFTDIGLDSGNLFSKKELAKAIKHLPSEALDEIAQTLQAVMTGVSDGQRSEYWKNRMLPFLISIWPKSTTKKSPGISNNLATLCVAAHENFPEALKELQYWLGPINHPTYFLGLFVEKGLAKLFPNEALDFLYIVVIFNESAPPFELKRILASIVSKSPELKDDNRFRELKTYDELHTHGGA